MNIDQSKEVIKLYFMFITLIEQFLIFSEVRRKEEVVKSSLNLQQQEAQSVMSNMSNWRIIAIAALIVLAVLVKVVV